MGVQLNHPVQAVAPQLLEGVVWLIKESDWNAGAGTSEVGP